MKLISIFIFDMLTCFNQHRASWRLSCLKLPCIQGLLWAQFQVLSLV